MKSGHVVLGLIAAVVVSAWATTTQAQSASSAPPVTLAPEIVTAARMPQAPEHTAATVRTFDAEALRAVPASTLDGQLRTIPAFSLFRRGDSLSTNPSAQGVSLRGLGPSGASRSLVLLDGVPLTDPFGGWVAWTKVPRENLARVEVVPGGGAAAWGNAALGGVVQLLTPEPPPAGGRFTLTGGDYGLRSGELGYAQSVGPDRVELDGRLFSFDGFRLVAPERRGPIDVPAWSRHRLLALGGESGEPGGVLDLKVAGRYYDETRGNGTPYTGNSTREKFASARLAGHPSTRFAWTALAYAQSQNFTSTFSSVNATRSAETPASDQFAVPATAAGAAWTGAWTHSGGARTAAGADWRTVRGETRENFTFAGGRFTRQRVAGGNQSFAGLFALHERPLAAELRGLLGLRIDAWRDTDGHRRETDLLTSASLRDDRYASQHDTELGPSAALVWQPAPAWRLRANAQRSFRRPTLNELYRPFRQGANITESNNTLRAEHATSAEFGMEYRYAALTLAATAFWNNLHDAVGNVTLVRGPGVFPLFGSIPAGGFGRQKLNLDRLRVQGLELSAKWSATKNFSLTADALLNDATVRRASVAPALIGKQVAQVPRRSVSLGGIWRAPAGITLTARVRWMGRQFEDDENALILGETVVGDLGASYPLTKHLELFLTAENVGNARIETGRSADGIVNVGSPRLVVGGLRGSW